MKVYLNNEERELPELSTVAAILQFLKLEHSRGIAIALNNEVLPRSNWQIHPLQENDRLTLIKATQGG